MTGTREAAMDDNDRQARDARSNGVMILMVTTAVAVAILAVVQLLFGVNLIE